MNIFEYINGFNLFDGNDAKKNKPNQLKMINNILRDLKLENDKEIFEIRMGTGKTTVIAPLLILHWCKAKNNYLDKKY